MNRLEFGAHHLGLTRRTFLKSSGAAVASASLSGAWLSACGDGAGSSSAPWWLQGNYAPVKKEIDATDLEVRGAIPSALDGLYVRNGSNPVNGDSAHWFLGDGMLHSLRLSGGNAVAYRNRWVRTGVFDNGGVLSGAPVGGNNQSNVSAIYHGGRLITSGEVGLPYEVNPGDLSTIGVHDFDGGLTQSFTAHPKIDPATGYLHFFGYWFLGQDLLLYHVADETGQLISTERVDVDRTTMIHSFAITEQDVVFWESPVVFDLEAAIDGDAVPFLWDGQSPSRIGVMPLGGPTSDIRWIEVDPFYVFHEVNAYRSGDDVVVDVCWHPDMFNNSDLTGQGDTTRVKRWRLNTAGESLTYSEETISDRGFELPTHDRRLSGRQHRYGWFVETRDRPDTVDFAGIGHIDYQTGAVSAWDPGLTRHAGEAFFVPGDAGEGEGWLFTYVYDEVAKESVLAILDAQDVESGPLAEVVMPQRIPYGFHGVWTPEGDL